MITIINFLVEYGVAVASLLSYLLSALFYELMNADWAYD